MKYRKKPVVIEAFQYNGDLINSENSEDEPYIPKWAVKAFEKGTMYYKYPLSPLLSPYELYIKTLEGDMHVSVGDYVIKGVKGELYPCNPIIFEMTYEPIT